MITVENISFWGRHTNVEIAFFMSKMIVLNGLVVVHCKLINGDHSTEEDIWLSKQEGMETALLFIAVYIDCWFAFS